MMESDVQQLGIEIQHPTPSPKTWEQLVADVRSCVLPVWQMHEERGVSEVKALDQIQETCAAVLLTNLLRDIRADVIENDRLYIPADVASQHGLDLALLHKALTLDADRGCDGDRRDGSCDCALIPRGDMLALRKPYRATLRDLVGRTRDLFPESHANLQTLSPDISRPLHALILEAQSTLKMIARHGYDTLTRRPRLGAFPRAWNRLRLRLAH